MLKQLVTRVMGTRFDRELKRIQPDLEVIESDLDLEGEVRRAHLREQIRAVCAARSASVTSTSVSATAAAMLRRPGSTPIRAKAIPTMIRTMYL